MSKQAGSEAYMNTPGLEGFIGVAEHFSAFRAFFSQEL